MRVAKEKKPESQVDVLRQLVQDLARRLEETEKKSKSDSVAEALEAVKEEARKRDDNISLDTLHQRLVRLDEAARSARDIRPSTRESYRAVLRRFCHLRSINTPELGQLILSFLGSPEENAVLEKERKFLKNRASRQGDGNTDKGATAAPTASGPMAPLGQGPVQSHPYPGSQAWAQGGPQPWYMAPPPFYPPAPQPGYPSPYSPPSRGRSNGRRGRGAGRPSGEDRCYRCDQTGHFMRDCPQRPSNSRK